MTVTSGAPAVLCRGQEAVRPLLDQALSKLDYTCRPVAAYHLGFVDLDGGPAAGGGGKAVRATLATLSAEAAGAPAEVGLPGAVAVELVHNFSLVHDDLMDGDTMRRHRPTVWSVWGSSTAILVGDALQALALEVLLDRATPANARAACLLAEATRRLVRGQLLDMAFEDRDTVSVPECQEMANEKTAALLSASAAIGAVLASAPTAVTDALARYGAEIGLAFQLVDDLLGIWGEPEVTGKPVFSDLRSRKKTLPICFAASRPTSAGREFAKWLSRRPPPDGDAEQALVDAAALIAEAGGQRWAQAQAGRRTLLAIQALREAPIPVGVRTELTDLANFIADRKA